MTAYTIPYTIDFEVEDVENYEEALYTLTSFIDDFCKKKQNIIRPVEEVHYWVGTMNRVCTTLGNAVPYQKCPECKNEWREVSKDDYNEAYDRAYEEAINSPWHC